MFLLEQSFLRKSTTNFIHTKTIEVRFFLTNSKVQLFPFFFPFLTHDLEAHQTGKNGEGKGGKRKSREKQTV